MSQVLLIKNGNDPIISLPQGYATLGDVFDEIYCSVPNPHEWKCVQHLRLLRLPKISMQTVMQADGRGWLRNRDNNPEEFKFTYNLQRADIVIDPSQY